MRTVLQILGAFLIVAGLWSLLDSDALAFVMLCALGAGLLINPERNGAAVGLRRTLLLAAFALALVRLASVLFG